jgi:hypothetical protein
MAQQTRTGRRAAASKAASTRKQTAARRSAARTRTTARQTGRSARSASRGGQRTARQATGATTRRFEAALSQVEAFARQAERGVLIPVGATLVARDSLVRAVRRYSSRRGATTQLRRFERRGEQALRRNRRAVARQATAAQRELTDRGNGLRTSVEQAGERVRSLV